MIGRNFRCLVYPLQAAGYLRLRYDLTHFKNLQDQLNFLIQPTAEHSGHSTTEKWRESIDNTINDYLNRNKINLQAVTTKQKREIISILQDQGLFDFKESSVYVASKLQIARATVYNYLKTTANFKKVHIHQVDAFTDKQFGGNPAGVVLDADELDESMMRKITRELNLSETAFILPSEKGDFQIRYFTPTGHEISFCGHSTVGSLYMIAKEKRFGIEKTGKYTFNVETPCGILKMETVIDDNGEIKVAYETPAIKLRKIEITHEMVAKAVGLDLQSIDQSLPVMYEETNKDLFIVTRSIEDLKNIECDQKSLTAFSKQHNVVALCLFSKGALDRKNQFHMRCYA